MTNLSRRKFLKALGWSAGGIIVVGLPGRAEAFPTFPHFAAPTEEDAAVWLSLRPDGTIELYSPRAEIGQGIASGLRQIVAEELGLDLELVRCISPDTGLINPAKATVGSESIEVFGPVLAQAAAALSAAVRTRAATQLGEPENSLALSDGVFLASSGKSVSLARLAEGDALIIDEDAVEAAKPQSLLPGRAHTVIGKPQPTDRINAIVTASEALYADDIRFPGMIFGAAVHPDQIGASVVSVDDTACRKIPGYLGMHRDGGFVGIVAERRGALQKALNVLDVSEKAENRFGEENLASAMNVNTALAAGGLEHVPVDGDMDPSEDFDIDLVLDVPLAAHVPMEPRTAVARFDGKGKLEIWTGSQDVFLARSVLADEMHLSEDDVTVHGMRTGGAFGGKTMCFVELEAARLARAAGRPVKVQWSRRDEFTAAFHRPPSQHRIRARLGTDGRLEAWWHAFRSGHVIFSSAFMGSILQFATSFVADFGVQRGALTPYGAARKRVEFEDVRLPIPTGPWRGLGAGPNTWAIETAMDALARKSGRDPVDFRLEALADDHPRLSGALKEVTARSGWPLLRSDATRGYGVACGIYKGVTFAAVVAEVMIEGSEPPRVTRMWCAHDCGLVINPDQVRAQIEGNLVWGLGMVLHEKLEVGESRIEAESHADYALPRYSDVPMIETHLIGGEHPPSGAGEAAIIASGAAITNAISALTGETVTRLPYAS